MTMASVGMPRGRRSTKSAKTAAAAVPDSPPMLTRGHQAHNPMQSAPESTAAARGAASMGAQEPCSEARALTTAESGAHARAAAPMSPGAAAGARHASSTATNPTRHAKENSGPATRLANGDRRGS